MASEITFEPTFVGDKWGGQSIGPVTVDGAQPTFSLARVTIEFSRNGCAGMTLDSDGTGDYPITIADADTWFFYLPEIDPHPLEAGIWRGVGKLYETGATAPTTLFYGDLIVSK